MNKSLKLSHMDKRINQMKLTNHWYCEGTFTITPVLFT